MAFETLHYPWIPSYVQFYSAVDVGYISILTTTNVRLALGMQRINARIEVAKL